MTAESAPPPGEVPVGAGISLKYQREVAPHGLTLLGESDAEACVDGVCEVPLSR